MTTPSRRYPTRQAELVDWARTHADIWTGGQSGVPDIGISQLQADTFNTAVGDVESKLALQGTALSAAKTATLEKDTALAEVVRQLGSLITTIDGYARNTEDPDVWARAAIDPPKDPSPRQAPPQPSVQPVQLIDNGAVVFSWEVTSGGGAVYEVQRQVLPLDAPAGPWGTIAILGEKRFVDEAVPVGVLAVNYQVRARISTGESPWSLTSTASFGSQGSQGGPLMRVA
ncbi:MAG: hypothetical protein NCW75_01495 [Phycisphaera sp.]|nr:MAG: hypothetical protein NCW75_01495 [Phycisphaera sp.]